MFAFLVLTLCLMEIKHLPSEKVLAPQENMDGDSPAGVVHLLEELTQDGVGQLSGAAFEDCIREEKDQKELLKF